MSEGLENGLAAIDAFTAGNPDADLIRAKCRGLLHGYDARYRNAGYVPISVEQTYTAPLINPETNRPSTKHRMAGKLDVLCQYNGQMVVFDHKSTSQDITDPAGPYWRQLVVEGQVSHYMLLVWQHGTKADSAVWDVMRKPLIKPKKLKPADAKAATSLREYCNRPVSQESVDAVVRDGRETAEMYEARVAWECTQEEPDRYFQRRQVPRLDSELLEYARELWEHSQEILHARSTDRHARNSGACMLYNAPCKFLGICSGYDTPDSDKWVRKPQVHVELPELDGDGREHITNSRIRCFQTCRRKHYFQYELGIERADEEEREALFFGSCWHEGLRAWWETLLLPKEYRNDDCDQSTDSGFVNGSASEAVDAR